MNSKRIVNIIFILSLVVVSGLAARPASAKAPLQFELPVDWSGLLTDTPCDFDIYDTSHGIQRSTYWFDEDGVLTMGINFFYITGSWEANGKSIDFNYNYGIHGRLETFPEYTLVWLGISPHIIIPGEGTVIKLAGYYAYTYTIEDPENPIFQDVITEVGVAYANWDTICAYLAP